MAEHTFFSCYNCKHCGAHVNAMWSVCKHPEVAKMNIVGRDNATYTPEDWLKIDELANNILKAQVLVIDEQVANFEFPYKYDCVSIVGCEGFEQRTTKIYNRGIKK